MFTSGVGRRVLGAAAGLLLLVVLAGCAMAPGRPTGRGGDTPRRAGGGPGAAEAPPPAWVVRVRFPAHLERPGAADETRIAHALVQVREGDFAASTTGSRDLLARGEIAVPYLGYAAGREAPGEASLRLQILLEMILVRVPAEHLAAHLASPHGAVRAAACHACAERDAREHARAIVPLLDDPDVTNRRAAVAALRRMSKEFFGYRPSGSAAGRAAAADRWRVFWGLRPPR